MFKFLKWFKRTTAATSISKTASQSSNLESTAEIKNENDDRRATSSMGYLERFDHIVTQSGMAKAMPHEPAKSTTLANKQPVLKFDSKRNYESDFGREVLCSANIDEHCKLEFVHAALADKESDLVRHFPTFCPCVSEQPELAMLLVEHFRKKSADADPANPYETYKHFEFIALNNLSGSNELIDDYFANRPAKNLRYTEEALLANLLLQRGRVEDALAITHTLVQDIEAGELSGLTYNRNLCDEDLFIALYFNVDDLRKNEVVDLVFRYCDIVKTGSWRYDLEEFLRHIDRERYAQLLVRHLERSKSEGMNEDGENHEYSSLLMLAIRAQEDNNGLFYWQKFINSRPMWLSRKDEPPQQEFERALFTVVNECAPHIESDVDKKHMIIEAIGEHHSSHSNTERENDRFISELFNTVLTFFPALSDGEIHALIPAHYDVDLEKWKHKIDDIRYKVTATDTDPKSARPSQEQVLAIFQSHGYLSDKSLSAYDEFAGTYAKPSKLIDGTGNTAMTYGDLCEYPVRYDDFYYHEIYPILLKNGLKAPMLEQQGEEKKQQLTAESVQLHKQIKRLRDDSDDQYEKIRALQQKISGIQDALGVYTLAVTSDTTTRYVHIESTSDSYTVRPLCLALNLALMENQCNMRIIQMMDGDPVEWLGVFNPDEFMPLLKDLEIYAFADDFDDGLMPLPERIRGAY